MEIIYSVAYLLIGVGTVIGFITGAEDSHDLLVIVVVGIIFGALWPVFWSVKITQKLMNV